MFTADDDLGFSPLCVNLFGGPGMQMQVKQFRQTNDVNIPAFVSLVQRVACGLPPDARFSLGWRNARRLMLPPRTWDLVQLRVPENIIACTGRWLVKDRPIVAGLLK